MVVAVIEEKKDEIAALCREYGVRSLWVFGSATTDRFDPETSDIDFLVDLGEFSSDYGARYFDFRRTLGALFERDVDLQTVAGLRHGWFRDEVVSTRVRVYDATNDQLAA